MVKQIFSALVGYGFAFVSLQFLPSIQKQGLSGAFSFIIFNLDRVFVGSVAFVLSFLFLSVLIRSGMMELYAFVNKLKVSYSSFFTSFIIVICFYVIAQEEISIAIGLLIFSIIYGMISVDREDIDRHVKKQQ